ncbi:MAG: protein-L-isoaspartate O-methyltransferase [Caulobacter sp.]|nr:protein-L-isoaspartate O-methyltransferase [Caulobacter sp.]
MSADFAAARLNMVESQVRPSDVTDLALVDAIRAVARETLLPADKGFAAYADAEVEYAPGRWMMRPRDAAKLMQSLQPREGEKALAIAAPFAAAVLGAMGVKVSRLDDGDLSAAPAGPFDLIICEGAVARVPDSWKAALATGGRLGVVERNGPMGKALVHVRADDGVAARAVFDSAVPWLSGFEPVHGFAF